MAGMGWLATMRRWLGVEPAQQPALRPHPNLTSREERLRIDERIHKTRIELDMLLAQAALDHFRSRDRQPDAPS